MKKTILFLIFCTFFFSNFAQNLIPNPSFESFRSLPTDNKGFKYFNNWLVINGLVSFYHKKAIVDPNGFSFKIPSNCSGFQATHSGDAYISIQAVNKRIEHREAAIIQTKLKTQLIEGHKYYTEVFISLAENSTITTSSLWIYFSDSSFANINSNKKLFLIQPQIINNKDSFVTDTLNWVKFSGVYTAKGTEKYFLFGTQEREMKIKNLTDQEHLQWRGDFYVDDFLVEDLTAKFDFNKNEPLILKNILFKSASSQLLEESFNELNSLSNYLKATSTLKIEIQGHTDNKGDKENNRILSENRAKAVMDYLIEKGISAQMLTYKGFGDSKPIDSNTTDKGKANNRRVEIKIME